MIIPLFLLLLLVPDDLHTATYHLLFVVGKLYKEGGRFFFRSPTLFFCAGGIAIGNAYLLPWAMLPNVIDDSDLQHGVRYESLFFSFFVFFQKFAVVRAAAVYCSRARAHAAATWPVFQGFTLGLSTLALDVAGYITDPCCGQVNWPQLSLVSAVGTHRHWRISLCSNSLIRSPGCCGCCWAQSRACFVF